MPHVIISAENRQQRFDWVADQVDGPKTFRDLELVASGWRRKMFPDT
jgi:hypothetical protein